MAHCCCIRPTPPRPRGDGVYLLLPSPPSVDAEARNTAAAAPQLLHSQLLLLFHCVYVGAERDPLGRTEGSHASMGKTVLHLTNFTTCGGLHLEGAAGGSGPVHRGTTFSWADAIEQLLQQVWCLIPQFCRTTGMRTYLPDFLGGELKVRNACASGIIFVLMLFCTLHACDALESSG